MIRRGKVVRSQQEDHEAEIAKLRSEKNNLQAELDDTRREQRKLQLDAELELRIKERLESEQERLQSKLRIAQDEHEAEAAKLRKDKEQLESKLRIAQDEREAEASKLRNEKSKLEIELGKLRRDFEILKSEPGRQHQRSHTFSPRRVTFGGMSLLGGLGTIMPASLNFFKFVWLSQMVRTMTATPTQLSALAAIGPVSPLWI